MASDNNGAAVPLVPIVKAKPDFDQKLAQDPEYADEEDMVGSMPATGSDITEKDVAEELKEFDPDVADYDQPPKPLHAPEHLEDKKAT